MPLKVGEGLLAETFTIFRECGRGRNECVAYWAGSVNEPDVVDRVIHPDHLGEPGFYEIDQDWLNRIWFKLNAEKIDIRVQVHTHHGLAFHSPLDDRFPLMQTDGFLSLVIPSFAEGPVGLEGTYLAELHAGGTWAELDPSLVLEVGRCRSTEM
ncbi:MAG TPA: hypothetical protein VFM96_02920 [Gaiellaceae bacterium]|nr:hypothetical protein [Gaiellaceae bacterium]